MNQPFSPLLWLCTITAVLLNSFALLDPNGTYESYLAGLDADTPAISAMFTALSNGVLPWEKADESEQESSPDAQPPADTDAAPVFDPEDISESSEPADTVPPEEVVPMFTTVDASYFDDALFIGDSHTDGFRCYAGLPNATYYCQNGLTVWTVWEKAFIQGPNGKITLEKALTDNKFGKIYILLGINELGDGTAETFAWQYAAIINKICALQPDATVYVQSIFHSTQEKSDSSFFKNDVINERNSYISAFCDNKRVFYLDCNSVFDDETGVLKKDYSGDGIHVKAPYYVEWKQFLFEHAANQ